MRLSAFISNANMETYLFPTNHLYGSSDKGRYENSYTNELIPISLFIPSRQLSHYANIVF